MVKLSNKVIGYFSYIDTGDVLCDDHDACVIAGSKKLMLRYLEEMISEVAPRGVIKKTRFSEIIRGLHAGAAYAFDKESSKLFLPLARRCGVKDLPNWKDFFSQPSPTGLHFMKIKII